MPQTSANLAEALLDVIQEWELKDKKFVVVSDGGANIKKAINDLGWVQIPCFAHLLNLSIAKYGFLNVPALTTIRLFRNVAPSFTCSTFMDKQ